MDKRASRLLGGLTVVSLELLVVLKMGAENERAILSSMRGFAACRRPVLFIMRHAR